MRRNGFVSNSSSSSFLLKTQGDYNCFTSIYGSTRVHLVADLKDKFDNYKLSVDDVITENFTALELWPLYGSVDLRQFVEDVRKLDDSYWITEDYDRDEAYLNDMDFEVFEGDL